MEYNQTQTDQVLKNFKFLNKYLPGEDVRKSYISVGSHLFVNFGDEFEAKYANGKPYLKSPWSIWLGANVDWRLTQNGQFIAASSQSYDQMNSNIQSLVGRKYISCTIISQLMDIQFEFEGGYQLTSFFDVLINEQWTIFCSNGNNIGLDAETAEQAKDIYELSKHFHIKKLHRKSSLPIDLKLLKNWSIEGTNLYLMFEDALTLCLDHCSWRIEEGMQYRIGIGDYGLNKNTNISKYLNKLIGKRLIQSGITDKFYDAKFEFEDGHVINTFSSLDSPTPWKILNNSKPITIFSN